MPEWTAKTAHGAIAYETVECVSCECQVAKQEVSDVIVGDITRMKKRSCRGYVEVRFDEQKLTRGYLCQYCCESPVDYPTSNRRTIELAKLLLAGLGAACLLLVVASVTLL